MTVRTAGRELAARGAAPARVLVAVGDEQAVHPALAQGPQDGTEPGHRPPVPRPDAVAEAPDLGGLAVGPNRVLDVRGGAPHFLVWRAHRERHPGRDPVAEVGVQLALELGHHLLGPPQHQVLEPLGPEHLEGDLAGPAEMVVGGVGAVVGHVVAVPVAAVVLMPG